MFTHHIHNIRNIQKWVAILGGERNSLLSQPRRNRAGD
jgi:hypothetical protein